jgi:hypothetical protein
MIGTPHYMSPEQFQGRKVDGRSDLFSLAVMLYEMLTGEKPFTGEQLSTVMTAVIKLDPVEPSELNSMVDDALSKVIMKALSKNPGKRYADGDAFAAALRESLKPAPSREVTQVATDLGATIAGPTATVGADATIATGPPPPVDDAPSSPEDTVRGAPPELDESGAKGAVEKAKPAPEESTKKSPVMMGVIGAVVLALLIWLTTMLGGGSENHWAATGTVQVKLIDTVPQFHFWQDKVGKEFPDDAKAPRGAVVQIGPSKAELVIDRNVLDGEPMSFDIPEEYRDVELWFFRATQDNDYSAEATWTQSPQKPDDTLTIMIALVKDGIAMKAMDIE